MVMILNTVTQKRYEESIFDNLDGMFQLLEGGWMILQLLILPATDSVLHDPLLPKEPNSTLYAAVRAEGLTSATYISATLLTLAMANARPQQRSDQQAGA